jgi:hypothetical protein
MLKNRGNFTSTITIIAAPTIIVITKAVLEVKKKVAGWF